MNRYIAIHGHFYQPPRENPWLDVVEFQETAYPYHNWNKKITAECYAPMVASQIRDAGRKIVDIINIYECISFDFGPTLLSWLKANEPKLYEGILDADSKSGTRFSAKRRSALAQPYTHMIMSLANSRDKRTQVAWGIKDFEHRFKRKPEGMWLPETAVDLETLDIMADEGIRFTILAPHQAKSERRIGEKNWKDVSKAKLNIKTPYLCALPSGRNIVVFFYDSAISNEVSFGDLLRDGANFANRLIGAFGKEDEECQLVTIATDGEAYGHHHRFGDMALAFCLNYIEEQKIAKIINFASYLELISPTHEVEIFERTSWSCSHGIERWRGDCGCNSGLNPGWKQLWRAPLREALDWLRDNLAQIYEKNMGILTRDPWGLRDEYISVLLDRSRKNVDAFLSTHIEKRLNKEEVVKLLKLLEMEKCAMFMYTSCQWYFDDISGIEALQGLRYASCAIQLAKEVSGVSLEGTFLKFLEKAPSNVAYLKNGARIYNTIIKPKVVDLAMVGANFAMSSLFEGHDYGRETWSWSVKKSAYDLRECGSAKLALGTVSISSNITFEEGLVSYAVLQYGIWDLACGAKEGMEKETFSLMEREIKDSFLRASLEDTASLIRKYFGGQNYSLKHLFKDRRKEILENIFYGASREIEKMLQGIYEHQYTARETVGLFNNLLLNYFYNNLKFRLNLDICKLVESAHGIDREHLKRLLEEAEKLAVDIDRMTLSFIASEKINSMMSKWYDKAEDLSLMEEITSFIKDLENLSLDLSLRESQNRFYYVGKKLLQPMLKKAKSAEDQANSWIELFRELGTCIDAQIE